MDNSTYIQALGNFARKTMNYYSLVIGWDNEGANYVDSTYMNDIFSAFINAFFSAGQQAFEMEVADMADTWNGTGFQPGYDYLQP